VTVPLPPTPPSALPAQPAPPPPPPPPLTPVNFPLGWLLANASPAIQYRSVVDVAKLPVTDPRFSLEIRTPTLVVAAGADPVCATPTIERFAARLKAGHAIVLPGSRHEILMERDAIREEFWAAFDAFIPGTPDPSFDVSGVEEAERGIVDAAVAGGDD
jgi:pimeloyl-ACP methyl ester carboxylesterase